MQQLPCSQASDWRPKITHSNTNFIASRCSWWWFRCYRCWSHWYYIRCALHKNWTWVSLLKNPKCWNVFKLFIHTHRQSSGLWVWVCLRRCLGSSDFPFWGSCFIAVSFLSIFLFSVLIHQFEFLVDVTKNPKKFTIRSGK